ncbi:MAG: response regulator transcription factor [Candidatus Ornithospirochaeta sp.]|nr:response regulator transcription factor [Candidatus Ornithospirochaeta sp.]
MMILIVEDDADIRTLIQFNLEAHHYQTDTAETGKQALEKIRDNEYSLVILDMMLPGISGMDVLKYVRYESPKRKLPIIVASALTEETDIITALELGADDYITKPFSPKILIARIKSVLRRMEGKNTAGTIHTEKGLFMDQGTRQCQFEGRPIVLTATEFDILISLARADGKVLSRSQIIESIKGNDYSVTERSIDVQIASIRKKLGSLGSAIATVWGVGYRYAEE